MSNSDHSSAELRQIDSICNQFESAFKSGNVPDLQEYSRQIPENIRRSCLVELVILDAFYRRESDLDHRENSTPTDRATHQNTQQNLSQTRWHGYVDQFPELAEIQCPPEFEPPANSAVIDQRFQIVGLAATGGLGRVSVADDLQFGRKVAIKEVRAKFADHARYRSRFLREAEITGRLEHPSIVPVYAMGQHADGQPYYAMRLIQGRSMLAAIKDYHSQKRVGLNVELRKLLQRFIDICDAVEYAHSRNIIHRDIKPENIMLGDYGETLLVDWGLAKVVDQPDPERSATPQPASNDPTKTSAGTVLGTPAYMSPEQAFGESSEVDQRSDIFSLGATLNHLVTGKSKERSADPTVSSVRRRDPVAPLLAISRKAMANHPDQRHPSARAFANEIEMFLADQSVASFQDPVETKIWRWIRHHRALAGAATAALGAVLFASLVFAWLTGNHAREVEGKNAQLDTMVVQEIQLRQEAEESEKRTADAMNYLIAALRSPDPNRDGRDVKVVEILEQAVVQLDADFADQPLMLAQMLQAIGITFKGLGQFEEAKENVERAHSIFSAELGESHRETLKSAAKLTDLFQRLGDPRAQELIDSVLTLSRNFDADDPDRMEFLRVAAIRQMQAGDAKQAVEKMEELVPRYESKFGIDSYQTLSLMNDLANAYHLDGRSGKAASISQNVYETRLRELGPQRLSTIVNGSNYAMHLLSASDRKQAKLILKQLLSDARTNLGDDHFQTLAIMSQLGTLYVKENEMDTGIELLKESLRRSESAYGIENSRTLVAASGLGVAYLESGDYRNSAKQLKTVYEASVRTRGREHPETMTVANNLASAYRLDRDFEPAIQIFEAIIDAQSSRLGPGHPHTLRSLLNLAATLQQADRNRECIVICQQACELASVHIGPDSGQVQTALSVEAMAQLELEEFDQAKLALTKGLESRTRTIPNHWLRYNTMSLLGEAHLGLNELDEAEPLLKTSYEKMLGQKQKIPARARVRIDQARERLVRLYMAKNDPDEADKYRETD